MTSSEPSFLATRMVLGQMLGVLSYAILFILCSLIAWALYYDITRTHLPPGISYTAKLRLASILVNIFFGLALILEKLRICQRYKVWRLIFNGIPTTKCTTLIIKDLLFDNVTVRVYWPKTPAASNRRGMVFIPGGLAIFAGIKGYERVCRHIALKSDTVVVSVGCREAPEHPPPSQQLDCITATVHFLKNAQEYGVDPHRISVGGDSSGGTFAATVCQRLATRKDIPRLRAQLLFYPFLQAFDFNLPSYQQNESVPPLFKKRMLKFGLQYLNEEFKDLEGMMRNAHVAREMEPKYRKWIHADYIPEEFKARGYVPVAPAPFSEKLHEVIKGCLEDVLSPLVAEDDVIHELPETFILTCEYDVLRDDGLLYKKRLEDNGVPVTWHHSKDGVHGILYPVDCGPLQFPNTQPSFHHIIHFLKRL
uniref:Arylacetamide deacetylase-like 3 n=1 Tax=Pogona vitticeps TaxID=103695 RepID=A0A6J0ST89_9SAUR